MKSVHEAKLSRKFFSNVFWKYYIQNTRRNRNRRVTWFNPPYSQNAKKDIGKPFINLVRKHFPKTNRYKKIFKLNTLKLSYCCTSKIRNFIKRHYPKVLNKTHHKDKPVSNCNCKSKSNCLLNGKCLTECLVYKPIFATSNKSFASSGIYEWEQKASYINHTKSLRNYECMSETELSKQVGDSKDNDFDKNLSWTMHRKASPFKFGSEICELCLFVDSLWIHYSCWSRLFIKQKNELLSKSCHKDESFVSEC